MAFLPIHLMIPGQILLINLSFLPTSHHHHQPPIWTSWHLKRFSKPSSALEVLMELLKGMILQSKHSDYFGLSLLNSLDDDFIQPRFTTTVLGIPNLWGFYNTQTLSHLYSLLKPLLPKIWSLPIMELIHNIWEMSF